MEPLISRVAYSSPRPNQESFYSRVYLLPEFLAMMTRVTKAEDTDEELRRAFQVFDRDNSGTISTDELRDVLKSVGENLTETELDEMMRQVDVDGSGTIDCKDRFWKFGGGILLTFLLLSSWGVCWAYERDWLAVTEFSFRRFLLVRSPCLGEQQSLCGMGCLILKVRAVGSGMS